MKKGILAINDNIFHVDIAASSEEQQKRFNG